MVVQAGRGASVREAAKRPAVTLHKSALYTRIVRRMIWLKESNKKFKHAQEYALVRRDQIMNFLAFL